MCILHACRTGMRLAHPAIRFGVLCCAGREAWPGQGMSSNFEKNGRGADRAQWISRGRAWRGRALPGLTSTQALVQGWIQTERQGMRSGARDGSRSLGYRKP